MTPNTDLFDLIHSLSRTEKRHFKLYSSMHGEDKAYIKLFDAIEKQKKYDEQAIKLLFQKESFLKRFSATKAYLYQSILRSLKIYHQDSNVTLEVHNIFLEVEILSQRGIYKPSLKLLEKSKQLIERYQLDFLNPYQVDLELRIKRFAKPKSMLDVMDNDIARLRKSLDSLAKKDAILKISCLQSFILEKKLSLEEAKALGFKQLIDSSTTNGYLDTVAQFSSKSTLSYLSSDFSETRKWDRQIVRFMQKDKQLMQEHLYKYIANVSNSLYSALASLASKKEIAESFQLLEKIKFNSKQNALSKLEVKVFSRISIAKIPFALYYHDKKEGDIIVESVIKLYNKLKPELGEHFRRGFHMSVAHYYFARAEPSKSLDWLEPILKSKDDGTRRDIFIDALILQLFVHYDLGNTILLHSIISAVKFQAKKYKALETPMTEVATMIEKIVRYELDKKKLTAYINDVLQTELVQSKIFKRLTIQEWLLGKLNHKPTEFYIHK